MKNEMKSASYTDISIDDALNALKYVDFAYATQLSEGEFLNGFTTSDGEYLYIYSNLPDFLSSNNFHIIADLSGWSSQDAAWGIWKYDEPTNTLTIALRGTNIFNINNILTDIEGGWLTIPNIFNSNKKVKARFASLKIISNTATERVHGGFLNAYIRIRESILEAFIGANEKSMYPHQMKVVITGHSLGGALAHLVAFDAIRNQLCAMPPNLITFASPLVGNKEFVDYLHNNLGSAILYENAWDLVCMFPESGFSLEAIKWYLSGEIGPAPDPEENYIKLEGAVVMSNGTLSIPHLLSSYYLSLELAKNDAFQPYLYPWSDLLQVGNTKLYSDYDLSMATSYDGTEFYLVFIKQGGNNIYYVKYTEINGWTSEINTNLQSDHGPASAFYEGKLFIGYKSYGSSDLNLAQEVNGSWSSQKIPNAFSKDGVTMAVQGGLLYIIHIGQTLGIAGSTVYQVTFDGTSFTSDSNTNADSQDCPTVTSISNNTLIFAHRGKTTKKIYYKTRNVYVKPTTEWPIGGEVKDASSSHRPGMGSTARYAIMAHNGQTKNKIWWQYYDIENGTWTKKGEVKTKSGVTLNTNTAPAMGTCGDKFFLIYADANSGNQLLFTTLK